MHAATKLPIVLSGFPPSLSDRQFLAANGVRIVLRGHHAFMASVKAIYETMKTMRDDSTSTAQVEENEASSDLLSDLIRQADFDQWTKEFLR